MFRKICYLLFALMLCVCGCSKEDTQVAKSESEIIILYTANVNCEGDKGMTYAGVAAYKKELMQSNDNVCLVDAGNYLSGGLLGTISGGSYATEIMNNAGYDVAALGKSEFYYNVEHLLGHHASMDYEIVSCNFIDETKGKSVFKEYEMKTYEDKNIAFIGVSNPSIYNYRTKDIFENESLGLNYSFCQDEDGSLLYDRVQESINKAKEAGADYVIVLSNLGNNDLYEKWDIKKLIVHTVGIDAVIDGGSKSIVEEEFVTNKDGKKVLLTQPGSELAQIGKLTIKDNGISADMVIDYTRKDNKTSEFMVDVIHKYQKSAENTVAYSDFDFIAKSSDEANYFIRYKETNLGDFCADAYREVMKADIGLVDAGAINSGIEGNEVTYKDIDRIFPYNQYVCLIKATGKKIVDALEVGASDYPYANRDFLQVSGIKFNINAKQSPAVISEEGNLVTLSDSYRVNNVQVYNRETGQYEPVDMDKEYLVAMSDYMYKGINDAFTMFQGCEVVLDEELLDTQVLLQYIEPFWGDKIPDKYSNPNGDGRITIVQ